MNAAEGAWDNAKKMNEKDGQKGSFKHKSTVVGDTVDDPFQRHLWACHQYSNQDDVLHIGGARTTLSISERLLVGPFDHRRCSDHLHPVLLEYVPEGSQGGRDKGNSSC